MSGGAPTHVLPSLRCRVVLSLLPVSTGAGVLVTTAFARDSLLVPVLILVAGTGITAGVVARRLPRQLLSELRRRVAVGLVAGAAATVAYDLVRYFLAATMSWSTNPFRPFKLFGQLLVGTGTSTTWQWIAGTAFHIVNGLGFAVGYVIVVRRPALSSALVWALVLETFTILLYPDWLGLTAVSEFLSISMVGHLAYGVVLGLVAAHMTSERQTMLGTRRMVLERRRSRKR